MPSYASLVLGALRSAGGVSPLAPIYDRVRTRRNQLAPEPRSLEAIVRRTVQDLAKRGLTSATTTLGTWKLTEAGRTRTAELEK